MPADVKERLRKLCLGLALGEPRYVDMPVSQKTRQPKCVSALYLNKEMIVAATAEDRERAEENAAWRVVQVLTAEEQGRAAWLRSDIEDLGTRLESIFCAELRKNRGREIKFEPLPRAEGDDLYSCRLSVGTGTSLTEAAASTGKVGIPTVRPCPRRHADADVAGRSETPEHPRQNQKA